MLTTLLYGSESSVTYCHHLRLLRCLRTILNILWTDLVTNVEVLEQAEITSIEAILLRSRLRWTGHVFRMVDHRLPRQFCMVNSLVDIETEVHHRSAKKTS